MTSASTHFDRLPAPRARNSASGGGRGFELPALPFERHSLEPGISRAQVDLLYSHYHRGQIARLNWTMPREDVDASLATLADGAASEVASAAGEAWNLTFFWHGLAPLGETPKASLAGVVARDFGSWHALKSSWRRSVGVNDATWSWLAATLQGTLVIQTTNTGERPTGVTPLLGLALMPDAYRLDFFEDRLAYFDALWPLLNWSYAELCWCLAPASSKQDARR